jgi:hypothetical protein
LSETRAVTLENDNVSTRHESKEGTPGEVYVSQTLGVSIEEVRVLARELQNVLEVVAAHADTPVICERLGGAEITLGQAVNTIWPPSLTGAMLIEGIPSVVAEIQRMLDSPSEKLEEEQQKEEEPVDESAKSEGEDKPEEELLEKIEEVVQGDLNITNPQRQSKKEINVARHLEPATGRTEKTSEPADKTVITAEAEVVTNLVQNESKHSIQSATKAEADISSPNSFTDTTSGADTVASEALAVTSSTSGNSVREFRVDVTGQEFTAARSDLEQVAISDDITPLDNKRIEIVEDEPVLSIVDYKMDSNGLTEFVEEEILRVRLEEANLEAGEQYSFSNIPTLEVVEDGLEAEETSTSPFGNESNLSGQIENISPEQPIQVSLTIEEIEDSLIQLAEHIEASELETTENVNGTLDKIIEVPAKLDEHNGENSITETEAQEELELLFTKLLDILDIDSTPELIESLALLTLKWHLAHDLEKLKNEEEIDNVPQGSGTHEIIKKLLVGLSKIKKAMSYASAVGRSTLQLYVFSLAA